MIFRQAIHAMQNTPPPVAPDYMTTPEFIQAAGYGNSSGQTVTAESAKLISTAYRCRMCCAATISPRCRCRRSAGPGRGSYRAGDAGQPAAEHCLAAGGLAKPVAEPVHFQTDADELAAVLGQRLRLVPADGPGERKELFVLSSQATTPIYDWLGNKWYMTTFLNGEVAWLPEDGDHAPDDQLGKRDLRAVGDQLRAGEPGTPARGDTWYRAACTTTG